MLIYDRQKNQPTIIKLIDSFARIMCLKYGPYDNGHVIAGLSNGMILVFSSIDLAKLYQYKIFASPISQIVTSLYGDVGGISLIENKVKYLYVELGKRKFCTVKMPV